MGAKKNDRTKPCRECGGKSYNCRCANMKRLYGIDRAQFKKMSDAQGGRCAICRRVEFLVVDHDHGTGEIRGLLCSQCNMGLGSFKDSVFSLLNAAEYIRTSRKEHDLFYEPTHRLYEDELEGYQCGDGFAD